jgi:hypothetical protein
VPAADLGNKVYPTVWQVTSVGRIAVAKLGNGLNMQSVV